MTSFRVRVAWLTLLLIILLCALPAPAQESHWNELNAQVTQLYQQGKYAEALQVANEALKVAEATFKPDDARVSTSLGNLAVLYMQQGKYAEAAPLYQRALDIDEKALGPDHPDVAGDLDNLAQLYRRQGKYAEAERLYQRALSIREKALGPDHPDVAKTLNNLALLYDDEGKYAEAERLYQHALSIREKALGPDHPDVAESLNNLAALYKEQGKYADAEPLFRRALGIDEKALGSNHPDVAIALNNLALLYDDEGKYAEAEPLYKRALDIDEKALGPDHPSVATDLNNLAELYRGQGRYAEAEPLCQRALGIDEKALEPNHPSVAIDLNNLALLYDDEGKYAEAEPLYKRALDINEKALGSDHPSVATSLNNLAALYDAQGKYAEAEPLYRRALDINEKAFGPDHPMVAGALNNLAALDKQLGKYAEAEPLYQSALSIREKALGPEHPDVGQTLNNLAALYDAQGKYSEAEPLYKRALEIDEKAFGPDHPMVAGALNNLAALYDEQGKYAEAEPLFAHAFDNLFRQVQYNFTYMTEKNRLDFLATVSYTFPLYFSFVNRYRQQDPNLIGSMYDLLLWEKGLIAASIAGMRRQIEASGDQQAIDLLDQLAAKRTQIAARLNVKAGDLDLDRKAIDQLRAEADNVEKSLVVRSSAFAEQEKLERATWQQVRDALRPDEAAVEFARFHYNDKKWTDVYYYVALVVTPETKDQPAYVFLGDSKQIEGEELGRLQQSTQTRGFAPVQPAALPGANAYDLIWKPLEQALGGATRIVLSPDGVLNTMPLGIISGADGKLLMERYDLRLVSTTKDILRGASAPSANTALLVGDPNFALTEDQQRAALEKLSLPRPSANFEPAALSPGTLSREAGNQAELQPLPDTGAEISAIAELMQTHGWKAGTYTRDLALKRVVEQASSPRVVHLATHGFFLPDQQIKTDRMALGQSEPHGMEDPMLHSGLYFAGADRTLAGEPSADGLDNGVLTAMEAGNLNLTGTDLVVLSACNTGQGEVENGEGVFGLRRALQEAGAQAVLMSLWSVPDKETEELMQRFYSKWLSGTEMHAALKQAQLEMREKVKSEHDGHDLPYYWGAFVLVGR